MALNGTANLPLPGTVLPARPRLAKIRGRCQRQPCGLKVQAYTQNGNGNGAALADPTKFNPVLTKDFCAPWTVPESGIADALGLMASGDLFRYNRNDANSAASRAEVALSEYTGHKYCLAVNSGASAIFLSLVSAGVKPGDKVFSNALTFGAVPSAIHHAGASVEFVESTNAYVLDTEHLEKKCQECPDVRFLLISHMRGKLADMDEVARICDKYNVTLLEDCAHSLGVFWDGKHSGHHGVACCISTQAYKMLNSGEGGFMLTNDPVIAAKAIVGAGGYEKLYKKHIATPPDEVFESIGKLKIPNYSMRMSNLHAAVLIPQIAVVGDRVALCNRRYDRVTARFEVAAQRVGASMEVPAQHPKVGPCNDSLQFNLIGYSWEQCQAYLANVKARGVPVSVFGAHDNARNYRTWEFLGDLPVMAQTDHIIRFAVDVRLPPQFDNEDFDLMADCLAAGFLSIGEPEQLSKQEAPAAALA
ncbi:unnamed protein product [Ostreobium quekettii]|uniref:Pyridoxal phosphate-dependent transferase n=1 Tax=Ostreobium quekettii TaxID=121088 RepID=A0A8S1J6A3_9CHLO|nr:unnamed protein product [Ostreobium quekettii]